ncbi:sensor histidine kinase [Dokdonia sp.]|uniref:sensor histidine kinase n=1 Tax=Dokdonia sp. TaxID=2024995 RepID=UPI0032635A4E
MIKEYEKIKDSLKNPIFSNSFHNTLGRYYHFKKNGKESLFHWNKSVLISKKLNDSNMLDNAYFHMGIVYAEHIKNQDSARFFYNKALKTCNCPKSGLYQRTLNYNISRTYKYENDYENQKAFLFKTLKGFSVSRKLHIKNNVSRDLYEIFKSNKNIDSALYYLELHKLYKDSLVLLDNEKGINEIQTKYYVADKENQILKEQTKNKRSQTITYSFGGFLFLGSIIAFLVYRNTKRKQRIAEQDRELQIQKTEKVLKEKEIETINAMVSGQEKERLRLAGELHDNLGNTLATVRMQVENLERNLDKVDDPKSLLQKTNVLVNEAYDKVRSISHERNSGVMAKDGLLPAIQKLARTVSNPNSLTIEVQDFGLENRIPNELEITIFRIIQELVTNIVKHAQATEATISLTQHDNELNIMVEDNGKGFKATKLQKKDGMGLGSIERRVEHLEGSVEIDSAIGHGTSVSIDIPL